MLFLNFLLYLFQQVCFYSCTIKCILQFPVLCSGEITKNFNKFAENNKEKLNNGIIKLNVTKLDNLTLQDTNYIKTSTDGSIKSTTLISDIHKSNTTKDGIYKTPLSNLTDIASSIDFKDNIMSSMIRKSTKLPMINESDSDKLPGFSKNNSVKVFSGKEVTIMQYSNGKQINVARKTDQIIFGSGSEKDKKTKIDELSQYLATEKPIVNVSLNELVKKELDTFVGTIDCYRNISLVSQNFFKLPCLQDIDVSKSSLIKRIGITKQNNTKLYGGINSLKFLFLDKGNSYEIVYEILRT